MIETHSQQIEVKLFCAKSLLLSAYFVECDEYRRLNSKAKAGAASKTELRRLAKLKTLMDWIHSLPPKGF